MKKELTMLLPKKKWGSIDGNDIFLITLENRRGSKLIVSNYGATAQSLFVADRHGDFDDVLLGYDTLEQYVNDEVYMGSVVGRYANRIAGGRFLLNGKQHQLTTRNRNYHQHGGDVGFNKKCFDHEFFETDDASGVRFTCTSPDGEEGYPGNLQLTVIYSLADDDAWTIEYAATTDADTIINLTQHAYFNLAGLSASDVLQHKLAISAQAFLPVNDNQIATGELTSVAGTPFDFRSPKKIGRDIQASHWQLLLSSGYDHSWVLKTKATPDLLAATSVYEPLRGRQLEAFTTEPAVHFYSGNFLEGIIGKEGQAYAKHAGFCLETQHFPDSPNQPHFPSTVLRANEKLYSKTVFKFSAF